MTTKYVDANDKCWHECPRCHGNPPNGAVWDEDLQRWTQYMTCQCEGTRHPGEVWHFVEVPCWTVTG